MCSMATVVNFDGWDGTKCLVLQVDAGIDGTSSFLIAFVHFVLVSFHFNMICTSQ